ncbi:Aldose reductase B [Toxocara canis]|uniref:Aldose reductase B n=1 Tax=Toxocara canis TaxID=6265 RepID=A0A0B2VYR5_TOXCA|nr:Aldose reductase B [Toxocara canis]
MPLIGLGTYQIKDSGTIFKILDAALASGYRMVDTAQVYGNEKAIGEALHTLLPKYNLKREDIFLITKLKPSSHGVAKAQNAIDDSLRNLRVNYIDLFIIHWPGAYERDVKDPLNAQLRAEKSGKLRAIGVSNYDVRHLEMLLSSASVQPALNQCECHPHFDQRELIEYCNQHDIVFQAYSSLGSPRFMHKLSEDRTIKEIARKYGCSIPQFLLAWAMSQGISVLPRSGSPDHVTDNFKSVEYKISKEDIQLVTAPKRQKYCWDPSTVV